MLTPAPQSTPKALGYVFVAGVHREGTGAALKMRVPFAPVILNERRRGADLCAIFEGLGRMGWPWSVLVRRPPALACADPPLFAPGLSNGLLNCCSFGELRVRESASRGRYKRGGRTHGNVHSTSRAIAQHDHLFFHVLLVVSPLPHFDFLTSLLLASPSGMTTRFTNLSRAPLLC